MGRPVTGSVVERPRGEAQIFAIRFSAYGERHYLTLGSTADGWTRPMAEEELQNVLADVRRGIWKPPVNDWQSPSGMPSFHGFASEWFEGIRNEGLAANTLLDYEWQLTKHLLPFFAGHNLDEITIAEVDRYRQAKVREGALSATSINRTIQRLAQVLEVAVERELIERNTARGKRRRLKPRKPTRTTLDRAEQIEALLLGARAVDANARVDQRTTPRATLLSILVFSGLRIGEALALRWRDIDLAAGRMWIRTSKTDAGVRQVDLVPALREELSTYKASAKWSAPDDPVVPTETGKPTNPSNVRNRVIVQSVKRANELLEERGLAPLPDGLTPHSFRRTYISLMLAIGEDVPYVMGQVGHSDPKMTLSVYAQVMFRGTGEKERLMALVEGADEGFFGTSAKTPAPDVPTEIAQESGKPAGSGPFPDGRGWFRTTDLSRVKRPGRRRKKRRNRLD